MDNTYQSLANAEYSSRNHSSIEELQQISIIKDDDLDLVDKRAKIDNFKSSVVYQKLLKVPQHPKFEIPDEQLRQLKIEEIDIIIEAQKKMIEVILEGLKKSEEATVQGDDSVQNIDSFEPVQ